MTCGQNRSLRHMSMEWWARSCFGHELPQSQLMHHPIDNFDVIFSSIQETLN